MILGIDPSASKLKSKCDAWALFDCDRVDSYGTWDNIQEYIDFIKINKHLIDHIVIEDVYFNEADRNPATFKKLSEKVAILEHEALKLNIGVRRVAASQWMISLGLKSIRRSTFRDEFIRGVAKGLICRDGFYNLSIDQACAINIASWGARH